MAADEAAPKTGGDTGSARELASWRRALMPFAILVIIAYSGFFAWTSYTQFAGLTTSISKSLVDDDLRKAITAPLKKSSDSASGLNEFASSATLESVVRLAMDEREQRADLVRAGSGLMINLWTRSMGFLTGMILAMVGAVFVLSRLDDAGSELSAEQGAIKGSLKTSSPGIVLAVLGTGLMIMAMQVRYSEKQTSSDDTEHASKPAKGPRNATRPTSAETCADLPSTAGCEVKQAQPANTGEKSQ